MADVQYTALCVPLRLAMPKTGAKYDVKVIDFGAEGSYTTGVEAEQTFLAGHVTLGHCEVYVEE
jgi:hypothetical protein